MSELSDITDAFEFHIPTPRQKFLQAHGFNKDPFRYHVTEQEWGLSRSLDGTNLPNHTWLNKWRDQFHFPPLDSTSSFNQTSPTDNSPTLLVTGNTGSGKTALLYHWMEKEARDESDTLVIFYDCAELTYSQSPIPIQEYWARAVVVAVILHLLRDFKGYRYEHVQQWIKILVTLGGTVVQWWIQQLLEKDDPRRTTWQLLRYPVFYPLEITPARWRLLDKVCTTASTIEASPVADARMLHEKITPILEALHIRQIQLYMDNLTQAGLDQAWIRDHVGSILTTPHLFHKTIQRIITIPSDLMEYAQPWIADVQKFAPLTTITIQWDWNHLATLLHKRCRTKKERAELFEGATKSEASRMEAHIIEQAARSPLRLVMLVSALLDAYAVCTPSAEQLTESLWKYVCSHWEFEGSPRRLCLNQVSLSRLDKILLVRVPYRIENTTMRVVEKQ